MSGLSLWGGLEAARAGDMALRSGQGNDHGGMCQEEGQRWVATVKSDSGRWPCGDQWEGGWGDGDTGPDDACEEHGW